MIGRGIRTSIEKSIRHYKDSRLADLLGNVGPYAIKFVKSRWAASYLSPGRLKISQPPALTWGTATYVTPLALPLSSALYGRTGLVSKFDASDWRIFDATDPAARVAYATGFEFNRLSLTWFVRFAKYRLYELSCIVSPKAS